MIKGFYAAVSGMLLNAHRQHVLSHNIANVNTPGFKQVLATAQTFLETAVVTFPGNLDRSPAQREIGSLGLGTASSEPQVDFSQGGVQMTGNPLDFAINGDNAFFRIQTPEGERYTRDGRFIQDADNNLVTIEGLPVLDDAGQPINLPEGAVSAAPDGTLTVDGAQIARLGLASFAVPETDLVRDRGNLFQALQAAEEAAGAQLAQGYLEMSNANPTQIMASLVEVGRSYEAAQQMVQNQDELLGKTIASLGRIA